LWACCPTMGVAQRYDLCRLPRGLGKASALFGLESRTLMDELNGVLVS